MKKILIPALLTFLFFACQTNSNDNQNGAVTDSLADKSAQDGQNENYQFSGCFQLEESEGKNKTVTFISLEIDDPEVSGEETVEMTGPEYNAVATGNFKGKLENGIITVIYEYQIEGSDQKEEQEFKLVDEGLRMTSSPLEDVNGVMLLKQKGLFNRLIPKTECP